MRRRTMIGGAALLTVALLTSACGGGGNGGGGNGGGGGDGAADLSVTTTEYQFDPSSLTAAAGSVTVALDNQGAIEHDFTVDELGIEVHAPAGESASEEVELEAGSYTFYCSVPGHRESGMEGTLTVE